VAEALALGGRASAVVYRSIGDERAVAGLPSD
jgi:hypothetical protein